MKRMFGNIEIIFKRGFLSAEHQIQQLPLAKKRDKVNIDATWAAWQRMFDMTSEFSDERQPRVEVVDAPFPCGSNYIPMSEINSQQSS